MGLLLKLLNKFEVVSRQSDLTHELFFLLVKSALLFFSLTAITAQSATITVDSLEAAGTTNGNCGLSEAIDASQIDLVVDACVAGSGADIIVFDSALTNTGPAVLTLFENIGNISQPLEIQGPGADLLTIDAIGAFDMFTFSETTTGSYAISGLTLANSKQAIKVNGTSVVIEDMVFTGNSDGGAIHGDDTSSSPINLIIRRSTFTDNSTESQFSASQGGAILSSGAATWLIEDSTFDNNTATGSGAAIHASSNVEPFSVTIIRSTFSNNRSDGNVGSIYLGATGFINAQFNFIQSTVVLNQCDADNNGAASSGGLSVFGHNASLTIENTIIANNSCAGVAGKDLSISIIGPVSSQNNFIGNNAISATPTFFPVGNPNANGDYVGDQNAPLDPDLEGLADNGGPTLTHLPILTGSGAVIDKILCSNQDLDQRGLGNNTTKTRAVDIAGVGNDGSTVVCDIGAAELGAETVIPADPVDEICIPIKAVSAAIVVVCL